MSSRMSSASLIQQLNGMPTNRGVLVASTSVNNYSTTTSFLNDAAFIGNAGTITADDTVVFTPAASGVNNGTAWLTAVTLTAKASPSGENQFAAGVSAAADRAALAAAINAHSVLGTQVRAVVSGAGVLITARRGTTPKSVVITETGSSTTVTGGASFGEDTLHARSLVIQADGACYLKFGTDSTVTALATMAGSDIYLDAYQALEVLMPEGYKYIAAISASGTVNVRVSEKL